MKTLDYGDNTKLNKIPLIMGIINATDNSFYDKSRVNNIDVAMNKVDEFISSGVDIIDVGGESTRPFSKPISSDLEISRVIPIIENIRGKYPNIKISVDTYKDVVAEKAILAGANIVNDISAFAFSDNMASVVSKYNTTVVLMHIKGKPQSMQENPQYEDVVSEVIEYFENRLKIAYEYNIKKESIILDIGIGFGKTFDDNIKLLKAIPKIKEHFSMPMLVGISRKNIVGEMLNEKDPSQRLHGSIGLNVAAYHIGADILRVHDVKETKEAVIASSYVIEKMII